MRSYFLAAMAAILLIGCASVASIGQVPKNSGQLNVPPEVADALRSPCLNFPHVDAGGIDTTGSWSKYNDRACGGDGILAGASLGQAAPAMAGEAPAAGAPVAALPGIVAKVGDTATWAVDLFCAAGKICAIKYRVIPRDYFGTRYGFNAGFPWQDATIEGSKRLVINGKVDIQGSEALRLELVVPGGLKLGGFSGQVQTIR